MSVEDLPSVTQFRLGIASGVYDKQLDTIIAAINSRKELLRAQHGGETLSKVNAGSRVIFNRTTTKNFWGQHATVTEVRSDGKIVVDLDRPIQGGRGKRWHTGIICPASILDVVEP